eukprot:356844-Chlamydomonas_euryale.AAC.2
MVNMRVPGQSARPWSTRTRVVNVHAGRVGRAGQLTRPRSSMWEGRHAAAVATCGGCQEMQHGVNAAGVARGEVCN